MVRSSLKSAVIHLLGMAMSLVVAVSGRAEPNDTADAERRLKAHIDYLCSDALEGRGLGSRGLELAATYVADQFRKYGLKTAWYEGTPFQKFNGAVKIQLGPDNRLSLVGPSGDSESRERIDLILGDDYIPLSRGGSGRLSLPLVFAGYGITDMEQDYDDYQTLDIVGKAPILLAGSAPATIHSWKDKIAIARTRGAAAVLFVYTNAGERQSTSRTLEARDERIAKLAEECEKFRALAEPTRAEIAAHLKKVDHLLRLTTTFQGHLYDLYEVRLAFFVNYASPADPGYPIIHIRRSVIDRVLKAAAGTDVLTLEKKIGDDLKPQSVALSGWSIEGEVQVQRTPIEAKNVIAVLEGAGELADETIVLGGHYDAVGFRDVHCVPAGLDCECPIIAPQTQYDPRMASPKVIHPGANDNASGTAVVLEVARKVAQLQQSPRRRVVFITFAVEEFGMIGSKAYVRQPLFPLDKTVAMINLDMVGRLRDGKMKAFGAAPPGLFSEVLDRVGPRHRLQFEKRTVKPVSMDQAPFHRERVPTLLFATGPDEKIHSPLDRPARLDFAGMQQISAMLAEFITELASSPKRPKFRGPEANIDSRQSP